MPRNDRAWIIDDDRSIRWVLERALKSASFDVLVFENANSALKALAGELPDVVIADIRMPGMSGIDLLNRIRLDHPELPVIIMTAHSDLDSAVTAYQRGAFEYLPKPFDVDEAVALARRACLLRKEKHADTESDLDSPEIVGESPAMQEVFRAIGRLSRSNITVLINGASGTGKELVARALHRHSPRGLGPFIALNMAAIPKELLESELFGHEKGAFTGAQALRYGRFEQADGGSLFLDEIGDMPADLQTRLLRVLSDGEFYRVGGHTPLKVNVRIIAATHQNLEERVQQGRFREDLFHRLNVIRIHLPALHERREDIPLLLKHFLRKASTELGVEPKKPRREVVEYLTALDWPGNVRQLENLCRWLTVMASGREIHVDDLPRELREKGAETDEADWQGMLSRWVEGQLRGGSSELLNRALPMFERIMIEAALTRTGGRRQEAARLLGWGRNTLTRKIKELGMEAAAVPEEDEPEKDA
jgi:two-component system, NtrC family, nitrogen regulation response regulator GlnG